MTVKSALKVSQVVVIQQIIVLLDWCNKGCGMCYPVFGMVHIKEPFVLIGKSSLYGAAGFLSRNLSGPLTYVLTPYNHK